MNAILSNLETFKTPWFPKSLDDGELYEAASKIVKRFFSAGIKNGILFYARTKTDRKMRLGERCFPNARMSLMSIPARQTG